MGKDWNQPFTANCFSICGTGQRLHGLRPSGVKRATNILQVLGLLGVKGLRHFGGVGRFLSSGKHRKVIRSMELKWGGSAVPREYFFGGRRAILPTQTSLKAVRV
jgi:hypothetical protein